MLFDKIASVYFIRKYAYILALEMASPGNQHCSLPICACVCVLGGRGVHISARLLLALSVLHLRAAHPVRVYPPAADAGAVLNARQCADGRRSGAHTVLLFH